MKSFVLISILLAILFYGAFGNTVRGGMYRDPKNPGMCTIDNNMILKAGDVVRNPHGQCAILTCFENGHVTMMDCMKQGMRPGCVEGEVLLPGAPYPECCKREIKCKTDYYS
ncbi:uncharacterized protein LOC129908673 [Episyrphus balteatus]|uniref:uncharacterized protein LOC129908673 n=1 Tax=Episyrphus balteatus TaxID=286459 RepID=UPI002485CA7F|nr:uncharacterized protein LOC129908673 [Episyrphus balteatus]